MGRSIVYCSVCGCPFEDVMEGYSSEGGSIWSASQTKYLADFRVIGKCTFSRDLETSITPFDISPPAHDAEFRSCIIQGRESTGSDFSCWGGKRWRLLQKSARGDVLYPLHEACIEIVRRVGQRNEPCNTPYTSLQGYYDALLRLHDRLTSWPYDDPDREEQLQRFHPYPTEYGSYKLEWEHQYYGAARFADGSGWNWTPEWEPPQWLCTDPIDVPNLTAYILSKLSPAQTGLLSESSQQVTKSSHISLPSLTAFEALSSEIIQLITLRAGATATLRLRRCSKTMYSKLALTQSIWRDHLASGSLVDYIWDLDRAACIQKDKQGSWDWRTLAQKLRKPNLLENAMAKSLESLEIDDDEKTTFEQMVRQGGDFSDAPLGLQNRCRLVKIVHDIEKIDKAETSQRLFEEDSESVEKDR